MLHHSFVLDAKDSYFGTMCYFEELIEEHRKSKGRGKLKQYVPTVGKFHTHLPMSQAFSVYDLKYSISKRRFVSPTFNELRHILNLSQIMAIGKNLQLITFDGDQTLYSDGGNFEKNDELALGIMSLMCHGIKVAVVTAAGYGLDGSKYAKRLQGLLDRFVLEDLTKDQVECFYVFGGECNYLLQCTLEEASVSNTSQVEEHEKVVVTKKGVKAVLLPVPVEKWQAPHLEGPKPFYWDAKDVAQVLDIAENSFRHTVEEMNLRAKVCYNHFIIL